MANIVPATDEFAVFMPDGMTPQRARATNILATGNVPAEYTKDRVGRGGTKLTYVDHNFATALMRDAFGWLWSFDVINVQLHELVPLVNKKTKEILFHYPLFTHALGRLTLHLPLPGGGYERVTITEVGVFDNTMKLNPAAAVASAASRALVKCMMRRFGIGAEFYNELPEMTSKAAWATLKAYGTERLGLTEKEIIAVIKARGITKDNLIERYTDAWEALGQAAGEQEETKLPDVPSDLGVEEPESEPEPTPVEVAEDVDEAATGLEALVEEAKKLGGVETYTPTEKPLNWGAFYKRVNGDLGIPGATDIRNMLKDIFDSPGRVRDLRYVPEDILIGALKEYQGTQNNDERAALRQKYQGLYDASNR